MGLHSTSVAPVAAPMIARDLVAIVTMISGLAGTAALSALGDSIDVLAPGWGKKVVAVVSIMSFAAGLIVHKTSPAPGGAGGAN